MSSQVVVRTLGSMLRRWARTKPPAMILPVPVAPKIGLALGGGFARGVAHVGILKVLERERIPLHCITGVSAGAMVAAAYASGTNLEEIGRIGCAMRFHDVARWTLGRLGLVGSERMAAFLRRLLKRFSFEEMQIPLGRSGYRSRNGRAGVFSRQWRCDPADPRQLLLPWLISTNPLPGAIAGGWGHVHGSARAARAQDGRHARHLGLPCRCKGRP